LQALLLICVVHEAHQLCCHLTAACWLFLFIYTAWKKITVQFQEINALLFWEKQTHATFQSKGKEFSRFFFSKDWSNVAFGYNKITFFCMLSLPKEMRSLSE